MFQKWSWFTKNPTYDQLKKAFSDLSDIHKAKEENASEFFENIFIDLVYNLLVAHGNNLIKIYPIMNDFVEKLCKECNYDKDKISLINEIYSTAIIAQHITLDMNTVMARKP